MKRTLKGLVLVFAISGLLLMVSCAGKTVKTTTPEEPAEEVVTEEDVESEDLAAEEAARIAEERLRQEEAARLEAGAAQEMFVSEDIYFDYNQSSLKSEAQEVLQRKAVWMNNNPETTVIIEGHCDERGTTEYNLALGDRRANATKGFLADLGIDTSRVRTISYGEEMPMDPGHDETAWAKNRRAHFTVE